MIKKECMDCEHHEICIFHRLLIKINAIFGFKIEPEVLANGCKEYVKKRD